MATKTKVEKTETIISNAAEKAGGFDALDRQKILKTMQTRMKMSPQMASTYYHNAVHKLQDTA